ncbi:uncharacterized protein LOC141582173 [Saimiri boliviensis]|uniref:uncharacterized protein LOC141582173 n=1 Tax=Saimiri boliviensis TaxID=27679 RepID=UPI003D772FA4
MSPISDFSEYLGHEVWSLLQFALAVLEVTEGVILRTHITVVSAVPISTFGHANPVPHPEILAKSLSITPGLCNITLECRAPGATQDPNVTWESKGLFRELEQRDTPGPAPNPWTLAVSPPLNQQIGNLTCVVSNQVDQKAATLDLGKVCAQGTGSHKQDVTTLLPGILGAVVGVLLVLGTGLYVLKTCQKKKMMKMEIKRGGGLQKNHGVNDGGIPFETLSQQVSQKGKDKSIGEQYLGKKESLTTTYSKVCYPDQTMEII